MKKNIITGTEQLLVENNGGVITITLNNPKYKNALSEEITPYLRKVLKRIDKDTSSKVLIIRGYGDSFCSGGNIKKMNKSNEISPTFKKQVESLEKKQIELTGLLYSLKIPTIAVITGAAAGAGFSIALACDIRIANSDAFFISNYSRIGLSGDYGISWFLPKVVGESKAKEIMFLNNRIYSKEALDIGLINILIDKNFEESLGVIIKTLLSQSNIALKFIKKNINSALKNSLKASLRLEAYHLIKSANTIEHKEAVLNFKKK